MSTNKEERRPREFKAKFDSSRNDLYWTVTFLVWDGKQHEYFKGEWTGYDDDNWWHNVAPSRKRKTVTGDKGTKITLEIDFETCKVTEILPAQNN
jgi:hypothetical protein